MFVALGVGVAFAAVRVLDDAAIRPELAVQARAATAVAEVPVLLVTLAVQSLTAFRVGVGFTDILQPLHAHADDLQQDAAGPARHEDRRPRVPAWHSAAAPLRQRHVRIVGRVLVTAVALQRHVDEVPLVARFLCAEARFPTAVGEECFANPDAVAGLAIWAKRGHSGGVIRNSADHRLRRRRRSAGVLADPPRLGLAAVEQRADHWGTEEDRALFTHVKISL